MLCKVIKNFKFSRDGLTLIDAYAGEEHDIPDEQVSGLAAEGFIDGIKHGTAVKDADLGVGEGWGAVSENKDAGASIENKDAGAAPENKVEIPDDWRELAWPALRSLAASVSPTPVSTRDDCIAAIEIELDARG